MATSFDRVPDRRDPNVRNKWTWYPNDVIPMWVADMDFRSPPAVLRALRKALKQGVLGYELPSGALLQTVAARMDHLYGWKVDPDMVVTVTGIVTGFNVAARAFSTEKRGYLIQPPVYNEFFPMQTNLGIPRYEAPLLQSTKGNILHYEIDWDAFRKQIKKASIFLLCNPHNPVGVVYSRADLRRMAELCLEHDVIIVADEIHSELLLDGRNTVVPATGLRDSSMLTQDENIVDIRFTVQYRLKNARAYLFENRNPDEAVVQAAESAVREIVGKSNMDQVLYEQRDAIANDLVKSIQAQLDRLNAGIVIAAGVVIAILGLLIS